MHRLFIARQNRVMMVDEDSGALPKVTRRRSTGNAFASNADGGLTMIHQDTPDQYHVLESVPTPQG